MNGNADITVAQKNHVLTVPSVALVNGNYVYVKKGNSFEKRRVTVGMQNDTDSEIRSGLQAGDEVAVEPSKVKVAGR